MSLLKSNVFYIPFGVPIEKVFAKSCLEETAHTPLKLTQYQIFLPSRRACRSLKEGFIRESFNEGVLLPRILAFSDFRGDAGLQGEFPPPMPSWMRQGLLMDRVQKAFAAEKVSLTTSETTRLTKSLLELMDEAHTYNISLKKLETLVPQEYAQHWEQVLKVLRIVTEDWPQVLKEKGFLDPLLHQRVLIERQLEIWGETPPSFPVISLGLCAQIPGALRFMSHVQKLPQGQIILQGLDKSLSEDDWESLKPSHPQFGIKEILKEMNLSRNQVILWPGLSEGSLTKRFSLLSQVFQPRSSSPSMISHLLQEGGLENIEYLPCATDCEEAETIALILRKSLETPGKTAALVTPDRRLAQRVQAILGRWNLQADDSAGQPLSETPLGIFFQLTAEGARDQFTPLGLLKVLKHPLATGGQNAGVFRRYARQVELALLRHQFFEEPLHDLLKRAISVHLSEELLNFLTFFQESAQELTENLRKSRISLKILLESHRRCVEALSASPITGLEAAWTSDDGREIKKVLEHLTTFSDSFPLIRGSDYPALLAYLLKEPTLRRPYGAHPRLFIWGPLQARLQTPHTVVLGGLNEGTWPLQRTDNPWLSLRMRRELGFPEESLRIGYEAFDFISLWGAETVYLTRASRVNGTQMLPSRWLLHLETHLKPFLNDPPLQNSRSPWHLWRNLLSAADLKNSFKRPAPLPARELRPQRFSVTQLETLQKNPYVFYAQTILGLKPLPPLKRPLESTIFGILIHEILEAFLQQPSPQPQDLLSLAHQRFRPLMENPLVSFFWWPRFERVSQWILAQEARLRPHCAQTLTEVKAEIAFEIQETLFTLTAKADRVDIDQEGAVTIIDYKTGRLPALQDLEKGSLNQLLLEGALLIKGGFKAFPQKKLGNLSYWMLKGVADSCEIIPLKGDLPDLAQKALETAQEVMKDFFHDFKPYEAPLVPTAWTGACSPYKHLARVKEWSTHTL